ncbi:hypothetical protein ACOMHN_039545 [Nucella lapillus]
MTFSDSLPLSSWLLELTSTPTPNLTTTTTTTGVMTDSHNNNNNNIHNNSSSSSSSSPPSLQAMSPEPDPLKEKVIIALAIVRLALAVGGFLLNVVAGVVLTSRRLWSPTSMLLLSLVVCDAFYLLLVIPVGAASISVNLDFTYARYDTLLTIMALCFPLRNMAQMASTYTTVAVTLERYLVILLPLKASSMWTYGKTRKVIIAVILFSILFNIPRCFDHILSQPLGNQESSEGSSSSSLVTPSSFSSSSISSRLQDLKDLSVNGNVSDWIQRASDSLPATGNDVTGNSEDLSMRSDELKTSGGSYAMSLNGSGLESLLLTRDQKEAGRNSGYGVWEWLRFLYQIYLFYLTVFFLYLFPNTLIPILNLQLVLALRRRKEEKRRLSIKKEHRIKGTGTAHTPTDKEEGLTYIVFGITFSYFVCCILPAVNIISAIASDNSSMPTSIYILNAAETTLVVNAATDFFFYCLLGRKFRHVFLNMFCSKGYLQKTRAITLRHTMPYNAV